MAELLAAGLTISQVARELGVSKPTVCHHARALGHPRDERFHRRYDWAEVQRYYDEGHSVRECIAHFGFAKASWESAVKRGAVRPRPAAMPLAEYLAQSTHSSCANIKRRLIAAGIKAALCETCGLTEWRGVQVPLELHHRNGDRDDNRLENLEILCPNCHALTENYGARNRAA